MKKWSTHVGCQHCRWKFGASITEFIFSKTSLQFIHITKIRFLLKMIVWISPSNSLMCGTLQNIYKCLWCTFDTTLQCISLQFSQCGPCFFLHTFNKITETSFLSVESYMDGEECSWPVIKIVHLLEHYIWQFVMKISLIFFILLLLFSWPLSSSIYIFWSQKGSLDK